MSPRYYVEQMRAREQQLWAHRGEVECCSRKALKRHLAAQPSGDDGTHYRGAAKRQAVPQASRDELEKFTEGCCALAGINTLPPPRLVVSDSPIMRVAKAKVPLRVGRGDSLEESQRIHKINLSYLKRLRVSAQALADGARDAELRTAIRNEKRRHAGHLKRRFPTARRTNQCSTLHGNRAIESAHRG
jgi:hypothetical protein